mgnify:CR=1 FL=1
MRLDGPAELLLVFEIDGRRHALRLADVREVLPAATVTPLPAAPAIVEGVLALRGEAVPVFAARERLGLPARSLEPSDHYVVAWDGRRTVALRVDRADGLRSVPADEIRAVGELTPASGPAVGAAALSDGLVLIHDLRRFLTAAEADSLDRALRPPTAEAAPA